MEIWPESDASNSLELRAARVAAGARGERDAAKAKRKAKSEKLGALRSVSGSRRKGQPARGRLQEREQEARSPQDQTTDQAGSAGLYCFRGLAGKTCRRYDTTWHENRLVQCVHSHYILVY